MHQAFHRKEHIEYLLALDQSKDVQSIGMFLRNHLKVAGGYWCLTSLEVLKVGRDHQINLPEAKKAELIELFSSCQNSDGGCGGNVGHDSHITATHYAVLVLAQFGALNKLDLDGIVKYISKLQCEDVGLVLKVGLFQRRRLRRNRHPVQLLCSLMPEDPEPP